MKKIAKHIIHLKEEGKPKESQLVSEEQQRTFSKASVKQDAVGYGEMLSETTGALGFLKTILALGSFTFS